MRPSVRTGRAFQGVRRQAPVAAPAWQAASRPRQSAVESRCGHGTAAGRVYTSGSSTWGVGGPQLKVREALRAPGARLLATGSRLLLQRRPHRPAKRRLAPVRPSAGGGSRAAIFSQTRAQKNPWCRPPPARRAPTCDPRPPACGTTGDTTKRPMAPPQLAEQRTPRSPPCRAHRRPPRAGAPPTVRAPRRSTADCRAGAGRAVAPATECAAPWMFKGPHCPAPPRSRHLVSWEPTAPQLFVGFLLLNCVARLSAAHGVSFELWAACSGSTTNPTHSWL